MRGQDAMNPRIESLERMLNGPRDGALLRYSLGNEYLNAGKPDLAIPHLRAATQRDPDHSAAWKLLGRALQEAGDPHGALAAYTQGIGTAHARGDMQAAKEMDVFAKRIRRALGEDGS